MKPIYRIIETTTKYKNTLHGYDVYTTYFDLEDFNSKKLAQKYLDEKYKEFEKINKSCTYSYKEYKYERLKPNTWKCTNMYDIYHNGDYEILNFSIIKLYLD